MLLPMLVALPARTLPQKPSTPWGTAACPWEEEQDMQVHPWVISLKHQKSPLVSGDRTGGGGRGCGLAGAEAQHWCHPWSQAGGTAREGAPVQGTPQNRGRRRTGSDDSTDKFCTARSSSCLATITTALNPAPVLLCLSIRNKEKREAAFQMPGAMQQFDSKSKMKQPAFKNNCKEVHCCCLGNRLSSHPHHFFF